MKKISLISLTAVALFAACFLALTESSANTKGAVTFSKDVAPIFYKNCAECHRPNDIAPMSLLTYKESRAWARSIKEKVVTREMPPWSPDPKYGEFSNDHRLAQKEIDTIVAWVDQGAKEGNPKDLPPQPAFIKDGWQIGKPDQVFSMAEEWSVEPGAPDNYINFFIPTNFKEDKWIKAAEVRPGNRRVVHHVIAFMMTAEQAAKRQEGANGGRTPSAANRNPNSVMYIDGTLRRTKMDAPVINNSCDQPSGGRRAGSGGEEGNGALLVGFAPGMGPSVFAPGVAKKVPAGAVLMFQMHYSAFRGSLEKAEKDRTSVGVIFANEPPDKMIVTFGVANTMFKIPAGDPNHEVVACQTAPRDLDVVSYMPHMHVRGKDMKYEVIYPDGRRETLLWVPKFNFNWQLQYYLKKPVTIPKGAKLIVTAHYDNSEKNKYNPDPKKDIRWGDPTYDEMMIGWMDFVMDNPSKAVKPDAAKASGK
jgi:mono/diheme cytochrome c family protein